MMLALPHLVASTVYRVRVRTFSVTGSNLTTLSVTTQHFFDACVVIGKLL